MVDSEGAVDPAADFAVEVAVAAVGEVAVEAVVVAGSHRIGPEVEVRLCTLTQSGFAFGLCQAGTRADRYG